MAQYDITEVESIAAPTGIVGSQTGLAVIDATKFAVAYTGTDNDGFINTYAVDGSYQVTLIDSLEQDTGNGLDHSLVLVNSTHLFLAYRGVSNDGFVKTFSIDSSADNITQINSLEHDLTNGFDNHALLIDSTHVFLAYRNGANGIAVIFTLDGSYNITETSSFTFSSVVSGNLSATLVDSTHAVVSFQDTSGDGFAHVIEWNGSYTMSNKATLEFDTDQYSNGSWAKLDSDHFALAYEYDSVNFDGVIKIFDIDVNGGTYAITEVESYEHYTDRAVFNQLVKLADGVLVLAFNNFTLNDGIIKCFTYDGSWQITEESSLTHSTNGGTYTSLRVLDENHLAYIDLNNIKIFEVTLGTNYVESVDETATIAETVNLLHGRSVSEIVTIVEDVTRLSSLYRIIDEAVTIVEDVTQNRAFVQTANEIVTLSESVYIQPNIVINELVNIAETIEKSITIVRDNTETVVIAETVVGGLALARENNETVTLVESFATEISLGRSVAETISISEYLLGFLNGENISYTNNYTDDADVWSNKYSDDSDVWSAKYLDDTDTYVDTYIPN